MPGSHPARATERFTSGWGVLFATIGMAVGTGNIWRFPRIAAQNGGGEFLIPWILFLFLWGIPLLLAEFALGKSSRRGPAAAIGAATGARHNWMGLFIGLVTTVITFYYSVVTGWCLKYFVASVLGQLQNADPQSYWDTFTSHPAQPVFFHGLALLIGCSIIFRGVVGGIERVNRVLVPTLFVLLIAAAIRAATLPGAGEGLRFLFVPDFAALSDYRIWLAALTQTAWSTGAGWGLVTVFGAYVAKGQGFVRTGIVAAFANNFASLLAGVAVLCTVFAMSSSGAEREAVIGSPTNEGLTFLWLPRLFLEMPGGAFLLPLFFLTLCCAAISSIISQLELANRMVMDIGVPRRRSVPMVGAVAFICGLPSAWSLGFFRNQDWAWGVALLISGLFVAITVIRRGARRFREQELLRPEEEWRVGRWFERIITWIIPIEFAALISWWMWQSASSTGSDWWNPFGEFTVGTVVFQAGLLVGFCLAINRFVWKRAGAATTAHGHLLDRLKGSDARTHD